MEASGNEVKKPQSQKTLRLLYGFCDYSIAL